MKNYLIAERYANGLNGLLADLAEVEPAGNALRELAALYETEHVLRSALANPSIDVGHRAAVLHQVLDRAAPPEPVRRLADLLLRRNRIALLPDVAEVFAALADTRLNRIHAEVTTALPLSQAQQARLRNALEQKSNGTVRVTYAADPEILGGVVVNIAGRIIDGSVRTKLNRLRDTLLEEETPG